MHETLRYLFAALAIGTIGYCGSEALFWSFPPEGLGPADWIETVLAYALAGGCALSAAGWAGCGGWQGALLGGAILGFVIEGVVVGAACESFPAGLVWTPLAWHATVTSLGLLALHRFACARSLFLHLAVLIALGLGGGGFAAYWPIERADLPPAGPIFLYQIGSGTAAVFGMLVLDRIGTVPRPPRVLALVLPVLTLALWLAGSVADPRPERLALPLAIGATLLAMRRLGGASAVGFGPPGGWRHGLLLLVPAIAAVVAAFLVRGTAGLEANAVAVLTLGPLGVGLWLWCLGRALIAPAAPRRRAG